MNFEPVFDQHYHFQIEKITVEASARTIPAEYTLDLSAELVCLHSYDSLDYLTSTCHWNKFVPYYRCERNFVSTQYRNTRINYTASFDKQRKGIKYGTY